MTSIARFRGLPHSCFVMALVLVGLFGSMLPAQPARPGELTIAAYNLENMFDVFDDPYTSDETTRVKPRSEIELIAQAIRAMDPDVIAVSEVENEHVLRAMCREMLADMRYEYVSVLPTNSTRGINIGVISRVPIRSLTSHRYKALTVPGASRQWRFSRDLLQVRLRISEEQDMHLFVVHFKSRRDSAGDRMSINWRLSEAMASRRVIADILERDPNAWVAIAGDFNDTPGDAAISHLLEDVNGGPILFDAHAGLPAAERITYLHEPYRSTIDYILTSRSLHARLLEAGVVNDEALLGGSDHAPVWARFNIAP